MFVNECINVLKKLITIKNINAVKNFNAGKNFNRQTARFAKHY